MCLFFLSLLFFFQINLKKFLAVCSELGLSGWQLFDPNDLEVGGDVMWVFTVLNRILSFLMTSPKCKLRNYWFFWVSTFISIYTAPKNLYLHEFSVLKGSLFCDRGCLNLQVFSCHSIQLAAGKALMWVQNVTDFFRFCYKTVLVLE